MLAKDVIGKDINVELRSPMYLTRTSSVFYWDRQCNSKLGCSAIIVIRRMN